LTARHEIDSRRIGIWGGSEGGIVAPVAAARSRDVAFLILVSTIAVTPGEQDLERVQRQMRAKGYPEAAVVSAWQLRSLAHDYVRTGVGRDALVAERERVKDERWFRDPAGWDTGPVDADTWWKWYRTKIDHDPAPILERTKIPVLLIFGGGDLIVDPKRNAALIESALRKANNERFEIRIFPGADHGLRVAGGPRPELGGRWDWPRVAPGYLELMVDWTRGVVKGGP
ncbi:MAG: alpha/beta hydrolase, partial [Acidobacteria bacterium]|nr:alpha/beta hydrolase [Acidobacteriota bacterium]